MPTLLENKKLVLAMLESFRVYLGVADGTTTPSPQDADRYAFLKKEIDQLENRPRGFSVHPDFATYTLMRNAVEKMLESISK